jgi:D-3-phosphoglycerate dehydrogenase / 2-oxoglutarate reductase
MTKKILITDDVHPLLIEGFEKAGYVCDYLPNISLQTTTEKIADYEGLIINSKILVDKSFLNKAEKLKFVGRLGSGMEIVDKIYAKKRGVAVFSSPEGNCNAVGEHALGMLLALSNNLIRSDREVRQKIWQREKNRGFELRGKTIGIVGFGHTGSSFARKLKGMEINILVFDKYKKRFAAEFRYVQRVPSLEALQNADIISFHLPLTDETQHLCNDAFLKNCKKGVILLNTSRGKVVQTNDLVINLKSGQVGGACLDVFENEKVETFNPIEENLYNELYKFENVVLSPHIAGWTHESKRRLSEILLEKILK